MAASRAIFSRRPAAWLRLAVALALPPACIEARNQPIEDPGLSVEAPRSPSTDAASSPVLPATSVDAAVAQPSSPDTSAAQPAPPDATAAQPSPPDAAVDRRPDVSPDAFACASGLTACGGVCVDTRSSRDHCGGCGIACDPNAECVARSDSARCVCQPGFGGAGTTCSVRNECADGSHFCGGRSGTCTAGAGLGYTCACRERFMTSGGAFPQCFRGGRYTLGGDRVTGTWAYHFMADAAKTYANFQEGDFYIEDSAGFSTFLVNNQGMRGIQRVASDLPLVQVPIPADDYDLFGVPVVQGATYVARAREPDLTYYIVIKVIARTPTTILIDWVLVYRPDTALVTEP